MASGYTLLHWLFRGRGGERQEVVVMVAEGVFVVVKVKEIDECTDDDEKKKMGVRGGGKER